MKFEGSWRIYVLHLYIYIDLYFNYDKTDIYG